MPYVTDTTLRPIEMVLALINFDNNLGILEAEVNTLTPTVVAEPVGTEDTKLSVDLLVAPSEVIGDFVEFTYKRVDLSELFSVVTPTFREVDVPLNEAGAPADEAVLHAELLRKYGVAFNADDFTLSVVSPGVLQIDANAENVAYTQGTQIMVEASLESRVATVLLDGFSATNVAPAV